MNAALINPFINSAVIQPPTAETAVASLPLPAEGATANISDGANYGSLPSGESDPSVMLDYAPSEAATDPGRAVAATLRHNPVTQALEARPNLEDELTHLIGVAGKRRRRPLNLPRFVPDFPALWHAMHDKNAPRTALITDPALWADAAPLFLRTS